MSVVAQREARRVIAFPKCGHTSVINTFMTTYGQSVQRGAVANNSFKGLSEETHSWPAAKVSIAVLRNPLTRLASAYNHLILETQRENFLALGFDQDMIFPEFCQHLGNIDLTADNHLKPQAVSLHEARSGLLHLVQLEQLAEQWPLIVRAFDLPCTTDVAEFNAHHYTVDFDHWSIAFVKEIYADDYKLWEKADVETRAQVPPVDNQAL